MNKLLGLSLKKILRWAAVVLVCTIPVYYLAISKLWQYELDEHNILLTPEAGREDSFLIIGAVTLLSVIFFTLLLGALILLTRRLSKRIWKPFYKTLSQVKSFDLAKPADMIFEDTGIEEFNELNTSLQKLISSNQFAYNRQKEFSDNASHELQTPLAIAQSKLDLLSQSKQLDEEQFNLIEEAQQALARAGRINKNLLLLTRIDNSQFLEEELVDLSLLLKELIDQFTPFFDDKKLGVQTDIQPNITVRANRILTDILLGNLLTNAIRHSPSPATIVIRLQKAYVSVSNTGTAALDSNKLFQRFASASASSPGTGLGLAIVKQISLRYAWQTEYRFTGSLHVFQVRF